MSAGQEQRRSAVGEQRRSAVGERSRPMRPGQIAGRMMLLLLRG
jgi:hypothetical protein